MVGRGKKEEIEARMKDKYEQIHTFFYISLTFLGNVFIS